MPSLHEPGALAISVYAGVSTHAAESVVDLVRGLNSTRRGRAV